jgi:hypothetical protein
MLCRAVGRDTEASRHLNAAAILAKKDGRHWLAAEAQHDMFTHLADRGLFTLAQAHAAKALAYYPKHHKRFPFFVADLAFFLVLERHFAPAVPLLTGFLHQVDNPAQHLLGLSVLVRALAGAGLVDEFQRMRQRLVASLSAAPEYECSARINLAEAERAIGLWADAQLNAEAALALATTSNDRSDIARAEKLLSQIVAEEQDRPGDLPRFNEALAEMVKTAEELTLERRLVWEIHPKRDGRLLRSGNAARSTFC